MNDHTVYSIHFQLDKALLDAYEYMQKYAVGLEQIVWDQEEHHLEFHKQFQDTEYELRTVSLFLRSNPLSCNYDESASFRFVTLL